MAPFFIRSIYDTYTEINMIELSLKKTLAVCTLLGVVCVARAGVYSTKRINGHESLVCSEEDGTHFLINKTSFPQAIQLNSTKMLLNAVWVDENGFEEMSYKEEYGSGRAIIAVKDGYNPVLFERGRHAPCSYRNQYY